MRAPSTYFPPLGASSTLITCSAAARTIALQSLERDRCSARRDRRNAGLGVHNPYKDNLSHQKMIAINFAYRDLITLFLAQAIIEGAWSIFTVNV
jgi:hypothetical protein